MGRHAKRGGGDRAHRENRRAQVFWDQLERCTAPGELRRLRNTVARLLERPSPDDTPKGAGRALAAIVGEIDNRLGRASGKYGGG